MKLSQKSSSVLNSFDVLITSGMNGSLHFWNPEKCDILSTTSPVDYFVNDMVQLDDRFVAITSNGLMILDLQTFSICAITERDDRHYSHLCGFNQNLSTSHKLIICCMETSGGRLFLLGFTLHTIKEKIIRNDKTRKTRPQLLLKQYDMEYESLNDKSEEEFEKEDAEYEEEEEAPENAERNYLLLSAECDDCSFWIPIDGTTHHRYQKDFSIRKIEQISNSEIVVCFNQKIRIYNILSGKMEREFSVGRYDSIHDLCFNPFHQLFYSVVATGPFRRSRPSLLKAISSSNFNVISSVESVQEMMIIQYFEHPLNVLIVGTLEGTMFFYKINNSKKGQVEESSYSTCNLHSKAIRDISRIGNPNSFVSCSSDKTICFFQLKEETKKNKRSSSIQCEVQKTIGDGRLVTKLLYLKKQSRNKYFSMNQLRIDKKDRIQFIIEEELMEEEDRKNVLKIKDVSYSKWLFL